MSYPVCPNCGAEYPHLCTDGTWLCDECRYRYGIATNVKISDVFLPMPSKN